MEEDVQGPSIEDYLDIVRRRKIYFILSVPVLLFITLAVVMTLPPLFRADGIILIQGQEIPEELVRSTVENRVEQQIEITRQRIMTSAKIQELIDKHNLYTDIRSKSSNFQLAEAFRNSMEVQMIEAEVPGEWGQVNRTNVAFIVSFMDRNPIAAQAVANELTTLFLEENVKARTSKADETAQFLKEEADRMQAQVQEIENKIAEFRIEYGDSLPELLTHNLTTVENLEEQILATQEESIGLSDQIHDLNIELSNISPFVQFSSDSSGTAITPRQRLMELKQEYSRLILTYAESHPDIIRIKDEMVIAEDEVKKAQQNVSDEEAINPQYRRVKARIESLENEMKRVAERRITLQRDLEEYNRRVTRTYQVQHKYDEMTRDYQSKLEKYQELRTNQLEANIAQNMEAENKAGSFKLIEPPSMPEKPVKPDRLKLLAMGFIVSIGAGIGLMVAVEFLDSGVRGASKITQILGAQPLAVVPHIYNDADTRLIRRNWLTLLYAGAGFAVCCMVFFHFAVMGLDELMYKVLGKLHVM